MPNLTNPVDILSTEREKVGEMNLSASISEQPEREHLLFEVVRMQLAKRRAGTAATKTRAFVRGGGRKPWRQGWSAAARLRISFTAIRTQDGLKGGDCPKVPTK